MRQWTGETAACRLHNLEVTARAVERGQTAEGAQNVEGDQIAEGAQHAEADQLVGEGHSSEELRIPCVSVKPSADY